MPKGVRSASGKSFKYSYDDIAAPHNGGCQNVPIIGVWKR